MISMEYIKLAYSIFDDLLLYFPLKDCEIDFVRAICDDFKHGLMSEEDARREMSSFFFINRNKR